MHLSPFLLLLPALATAQEQIPLGERLQGWFNKAKSYVPAPPVVAEKAAEKVAEKTVTPFNITNWQANLEPSTESAQDWLIFVTGGNKTCFGRCERAEKAFNESVLLFAADPTSPQLGYLNCEQDRVLCSIWSAGAPSVWHFQVPQAQPDEPRSTRPLHIVPLNITTVTPETIYKIHSEKTYEEFDQYDGAFHPTDGWLAEYGLNVVLGYVLFGFSLIPSWLFMIGISVFSRMITSRRLAPAQPNRPAAGGAN
ncbi:hypothetical protein DTO027B9_5370 [Paecilomyces variotii]|nr:hypothetical protein DTO027B9_5370 [Paecilomyces variotii]